MRQAAPRRATFPRRARSGDRRELRRVRISTFVARRFHERGQLGPGALRAPLKPYGKYSPTRSSGSEFGFGCVARGVSVTAVVETLGGAGGALSGEEPAAAFLAVPGVQVWHWPPGRRPEQSSKMHAKLAVADERVLLVSSANLTQAGIGKNIEAGLLVRGGLVPARAAEHVRGLQSSSVLERFY